MSAPAGVQRLPLVRERIRQALVDPALGYFTRPGAPPVGQLKERLDFGAMHDQAHYQAVLGRLYERLGNAWLTPSELFQPHYSRAVAAHILARHVVADAPLRVFEVGAGTGTAARDVLNHVRDAAPEVYASMRYTALEPSKALVAKQIERVSKAGHSPERFTSVHCEPFASQAAATPPRWATGAPCVVLMLEVLDNLPHDRVVRRGDDWYETAVQLPPPASHEQKDPEADSDKLSGRTWRGTKAYGASYDGAGTEVLRELTDPDIALVLAARDRVARENAGAAKPATPGPRVGFAGQLALAARWMRARLRGEEVVWLPTGALQAFRSLRSALPRSSLVAADFDALPDVVVPGHGAPLVSTTKLGANVDHATYLVPPGEADIFFPVDFNLNAHLYEDLGGSAATHVSSAEFLREWAGSDTGTRCRDGFDPMLSDFPNTRVLVGAAPAV